LDAGADPATVAGWINQAEHARRAAQHTLARLTATPQTSTVEAVRGLLDQLPDIPQVLADADPKGKQALYASLEVMVTYHPDRRLAVVQASPLEPAWGESQCRRTDTTP